MGEWNLEVYESERQISLGTITTVIFPHWGLVEARGVNNSWLTSCPSWSAEISWNLCKKRGWLEIQQGSHMESRGRKKNTLMVTPQSVKHAEGSGTCSLSSCAYSTVLTGELIIPSRGRLSTQKSACQWFRLLCSWHCMVLAPVHILMEHWVQLVQLPPGLGKNSSHGKTKGYKYHPNLPAAALAPALCGKSLKARESHCKKKKKRVLTVY